MQTEFYKLPVQLVPTFSVVLVASLVGFTAQEPICPNITTGANATYLPSINHFALHHYMELAETVHSNQQTEVLRRFTNNLLGEMQDSPQEIVDVLNQHFWELV